MSNIFHNIKNLVQGKVNKFLGLQYLTPQMQTKVLNRQRLCLDCELLDYIEEEETVRCVEKDIKLKDGSVGRGCGCPFPDLTFAPDKKCPLGKW